MMFSDCVLYMDMDPNNPNQRLFPKCGNCHAASDGFNNNYCGAAPLHPMPEGNVSGGGSGQRAPVAALVAAPVAALAVPAVSSVATVGVGSAANPTAVGNRLTQDRHIINNAAIVNNTRPRHSPGQMDLSRMALWPEHIEANGIMTPPSAGSPAKHPRMVAGCGACTYLRPLPESPLSGIQNFLACTPY